MSMSTRGSMAGTSAVSTRLNGNEAHRRLSEVQQGLRYPRTQIIKLCRMLEKDGKLEHELHQTHIQSTAVCRY